MSVGDEKMIGCRGRREEVLEEHTQGENESEAACGCESMNRHEQS